MIITSYLKQKTFLYALAGAVALGALTGCKEIKTETSGVLHEDATVVTRIHTPSTHESSVSPRIMKIGEGFGVGMDGHAGLSMGGMVFSSSEVPEVYGVVFKCQHGSFTSQGPDERHKKLYDKLHDNQEVDVAYKEIFRATYSDTNHDGKNKLVERVLTGFDFLDANPKQK